MERESRFRITNNEPFEVAFGYDLGTAHVEENAKPYNPESEAFLKATCLDLAFKAYANAFKFLRKKMPRRGEKKLVKWSFCCIGSTNVPIKCTKTADY